VEKTGTFLDEMIHIMPKDVVHLKAIRIKWYSS
jgi:hypothetical protein